MYGLFAHKEITALRTKHVYRLEIYKKDFSGTAMELEEFSGSPFSITLEGEGDEIYRPIIKSYLSINIIDKDQFDYTQFFTSDAFGFRVFLLRNGVRLWSGYITPDSFGQDLQYRSTINLVARDNIGYLSEIDYDWFDYDFVSIEQLLTKAFDKIQAQFSLDNRVNIFSGNKPITDAYIQTVGLKDKTWFEVLEEVLSGCGLQLRYINDNYTLHDIANEVELGGNYTPTFIDRSQRVDFSPAWREEQLEQDYLKIDNFFNKMPNKDKYEFIKLNNKDFSRPGERLYTIQGWNQSEANASNGILFNNPDELYYNTSFNQDTGTYIFDKIPNTSMLINSDNKTEYPNSSISTSFICKKSSTPLHINIDAFNELFEVEYYEGIGHVISRHYGFNYNTYHLNFYCNIFLEKEDGSTLICKNNTWEPYDSSNQDYRIELNLPETPDPLTAESFQEDKTQLDIVVKSIPENGDLIFTIYRWGTSYTGTLLGSFAMRIDNIKMYFKDEKEDISGQESKITINESNNVKQSFDFKYGQIPDSSGGYLAFAGGLHDNDDYHTPLTGWYRSAFPGNKYNLLELVGRGLAHHGKKARKIMTGTILFDGQDFSKILVIDNEKYVINGGTYDVTKETLTGEFIEVEPYSTDDYVITGGAVSGGSSNISTGGNRDTLLWTDNAANTKRVNELGVATSDDLAGSNLLIDNPEWSEAKRISADMLDDKFYWDKSLDTTEDKSDKDSWIIRTKHSIVSDKGISAYGLGSTSGGSASGSLGELVNVGQWADAVPTADRVMVQLAGATHWSAKPLADLVGLDTAALAQYLTANSYLKASDISNYLTWANLSGKPTVYPTSWELVTGRPTKLSDLTDDVVAGNYLPKPTWDAVFEVVTVDGTPALKVKYDILGLKGISAYADGSLSGGFSGALVDLVDVAVTNLASGDILKYNGTHFVNVPVSSIAGASSWDQITGKPEYYPTRWADVSGAPASLPASDVYPWAKAASKPTYTAAEVGALALSGGIITGSLTVTNGFTSGIMKCQTGAYPQLQFEQTNTGVTSILFVTATNDLIYRPDNSKTGADYAIYHSGNFTPSSKLDKSVWDEAFELKTVNGVRVISAKLDFLSVAGISAYATGPSSVGGGGGLDYDLLKQGLTGAITPDGYPFTISASFLGAIDKIYLTGKLANTYANKVHTHLWADITDRPTSLPANGGNADTVDNLHASSFAQIKSYNFPSGGINNITDLDFTGNIQAHFPGAEYSCIWQGKDFAGTILQLKLRDYAGKQSMMYRGSLTKTWRTVWDSGNFNPDSKLGVSSVAVEAKKMSYQGLMTAISGTTTFPAGLYLYGVYNNGYPVTYGNLLRVGGSGLGEMLFGWAGDASVGGLYYRSKRDVAATAWSNWCKLWTSANSNLSSVDWSANNLNAAANLDVAGQAYVSGWLRSRGNVGWYSQDYGGGIHMTDSTWVRVYGSKGLMIDTGTSPISMGQLQITCSAEASIGFRSASNGNWCLGKGVKSIGSGFGLYNAVTNRAAFQIDSATDNASFVGSITAPTFVGNLSGSASSVNGYDINSFTGYYKYTIDASSLDQNTYYPVTMYLGNHNTVRISVIVALDSGTKPAWSSHASGYSVRFIEEVNGSGWGTSEVSRNILANEYKFANANPVGRVEQMTNSSTEVIWVRGGGKYFFYLSIPYITPALRTSTFTNASQSVSPRTDTMDLRMAANGNGIAVSKLYAHNSIEINGFTIDVYNGALRVNGNLVATGGVTAYQ